MTNHRPSKRSPQGQATARVVPLRESPASAVPLAITRNLGLFSVADRCDRVVRPFKL